MQWMVVLVFVAMWVPELPGMLRRRQWRELAAFAALWAVGLTLAVLIVLDIPINQVTKLLRAVFEPIGQRLIIPPPE